MSWKSIKYPVIATSIMEAKYFAFYEATCETIQLKNFIEDFNTIKNILKHLTIYYGNVVVVCFSLNSFAYIIHFDIKY